MRIIAGKYKSRVIKMPKGIRPTQDKVRKALFDILGDIAGLSFLELFSGSGAVGLEAASRGVGELVLVEANRDCQTAIEKNIEALALNNCRLLPLDAEKAVLSLHRQQRKFDIIFLDPPYYEEWPKKILQMLGAYDIVAPNGFVVVQHFKKDALPLEAGGLVVFRQAKYGDTSLSFYRKDVPNTDISRNL